LTSNFDTIAVPLYILPATSSSVVRIALARDLRQAAETELLKSGLVIDAETLYQEADEAFEALNTLLNDKDWFFGTKQPGLMDAAVFAYSHLLLDEDLGSGWSENSLSNALKTRDRLVLHRNRLHEMYY
jgi:metaxin